MVILFNIKFNNLTKNHKLNNGLKIKEFITKFGPLTDIVENHCFENIKIPILKLHINSTKFNNGYFLKILKNASLWTKKRNGYPPDFSPKTYKIFEYAKTKRAHAKSAAIDWVTELLILGTL